ncbi:DUF1697 domain-containing protein [Piscinibacter sakaiensis]|uniref:DUF1697 domain-containing protein n=1 Tax=Piscinibacter sakaiensis TaxID=1547922 RepID=A0A0K8P620_PISS1|nr:DUF1697 domain-containing protein [Piscinibacter sakaiensis]GAP37645.1 hypothetical protein ISF6_3590 [Piscinibacter sakaiensis]
MRRCIVLLRGVNVGAGRRVPMAEFRRVLASLGHEAVATLLNSGNAVFSTRSRAAPARLAAAIAEALQRELGVAVPTLVKTADELAAIVDRRPFEPPPAEHVRVLVAFGADAAALQALQPLQALALPPERFVVTDAAGYLHAPAGLLASAVGEALLGRAGRGVTTRNWATVLKLRALAASGAGQESPR